MSGGKPTATVGHYALHEPLGAGPSGTIYLGVHSDGKSRAIKALGEDLLGDPDIADALLQAVISARRLNHPQVVPIHELLEDDGRIYLVMSLVDGIDLGRVFAHLAGRGEGLPIDLLGRDGMAPLHWSLVHENTRMAEFLIERGCPVDVRSSEGATPLMNAVQGRSRHKVAFLLNHDADPNARDARGFTALHRAAEMGQTEIVELLIERGAKPRVDAQGHTPRSLAESQGETAVVALLDNVMERKP